MVKYELESTLRRGQDHQQKQSEAVIRVTVFISRKDLISSQKWLLSTRVYFHTSGFILPLKHQGPFKAQSPQTQHSLRPGSGSSKDWDHIKRYRHLKLETILKSLRIRKVWTVVRRTLKHIGCIQSTIGPTRRDSTIRRSTRRAGYPQHPVLSILSIQIWRYWRICSFQQRPSSKTFQRPVGTLVHRTFDLTTFIRQLYLLYTFWFFYIQLQPIKIWA